MINHLYNAYTTSLSCPFLAIAFWEKKLDVRLKSESNSHTLNNYISNTAYFILKFEKHNYVLREMTTHNSFKFRGNLESRDIAPTYSKIVFTSKFLAFRSI